MSAAKRNMWIGGLICFAGIAVTAATYSAAKGGGTYVVAYGAIGVGALQFILGLVQYVEKPRGDDKSRNEILLCVQAMAYVAATDGTISDKECRAMNDILERITGTGLPEGDLKPLLAKLGGVPFGHQEEAKRIIATMERNERELAVQCAIITALSDDGISDAEWKRVEEIAQALGFASNDLEALVQQFQRRSKAKPAESQQAAVQQRV